MKAFALIAGLAFFMFLCCSCDKSREEKSQYVKDLETICYAAQKVGVEQMNDPSEKAVRMAEYISKNIRDQKVIKLFESLATMSPEMRTTALRKEIRKAGLKECPMLDSMDPTKNPHPQSE